MDLSQSVNIAIVGRSNTGKSSLMNALLKLSRREALKVTKVGIQTHLTKDFVIQKFFNDDVYLIDTPTLSYQDFEFDGIIHKFTPINLTIFVVTGFPTIYDQQLLNIVKQYCNNNLWILLNQIDIWDNCGCEYITNIVNKWKKLLEINHIYLTSTKGYDPKSKIPSMDIRGVKALREDIYNFIEEKIFVKSITIIENKPKFIEKEIKDNIDPLSFQSALKSSKNTAYKSYEISLKYSNIINYILQNLISTLDKHRKISTLNQDKNKELEKSFNKVTSEIKRILNKDIEELKLSLANKKQNLEDYSIVLFGRTRAGKSTIREALTNGDGSTIGKGGQRTTRDVHEYRWNHLRLIDTPGIEAYKGEEDTHKATKKVDEADMVLFLTSDDSVQPGEFEEMARLSQINKPFIVLLNVKAKLETEAQLKRFLTKPEKSFDKERLLGHHHHIQKYVNQYLHINQIQIIDIQARAGFLSNLPEYKQYKSELWKLSRLEQVYSVIAEDIYNYGNKRRASTFFDGTKVLINNIEKQLLTIKKDINSQLNFVQKKEKETKKLFSDFTKDTDRKIDSEIKVIFSQFKQKVPIFVDQALSSQNAQKQWENKQKELKEKLEKSIERIFGIIIKELKEKLLEFEQEYSYDTNKINFSFNFSNLDKEIFGYALKGVGIVLGVIGAGIIIFNPAAWVVGACFTFGNMIFNFFSDKVKDEEKRKLNQQKEKTKNDLITQLNKQEQELIIKLKKEIKCKLEEIEKNISAPSEFLSTELSFINQQIFIAEQEIKKVLNNLQNDHQLIQQISNN